MCCRNWSPNLYTQSGLSMCCSDMLLSVFQTFGVIVLFCNFASKGLTLDSGINRYHVVNKYFCKSLYTRCLILIVKFKQRFLVPYITMKTLSLQNIFQLLLYKTVKVRS